jgi:hypothetical protein
MITCEISKCPITYHSKDTAKVKGILPIKNNDKILDVQKMWFT